MNLMDRWMQKLYWNSDAFKDSTNFEHIKTHYYWSHTSVSSNPPTFFDPRWLIYL
jgi:glutathionyl-hydroquinone reductase